MNFNFFFQSFEFDTVKNERMGEKTSSQTDMFSNLEISVSNILQYIYKYRLVRFREQIENHIKRLENSF